MKILEDRIIWDRDDFLAGYVPDPQASFRYNENGAAAMSNIDVFTIGPGVLSVGLNPTNITGTSGGGSPVPNSVLHDFTIDFAVLTGYALGTDLHQVNTDTDTLTTTGGWPHALTAHGGHTTPTGALGSVVVANRSGTRKLFYSWTDNTDWDVGEFDLSSTFDDDFMSTVPTTPLATTDLTDGVGKPHPLIYTSDNLVLMGSGRYVHAYKCSTNTFQSKVLTLPAGYDVVGFAESEEGYDTVVFATTSRTTGLSTNKRGRSQTFWWSIDRPASWYKSPPIPDDDVSAPFAAFGTVGCFTGHRTKGSNVSLRIYEDGRWVPKFHWSGSLPTVGGVEIHENTVVWNSSGALYRWGPRYEKYPVSTQQFASMSGTTSGFLKSAIRSTSDTFYVSSGTGTSGIQKLTQFGTGSWQGASASPNFPLGKKGKVVGVQVYLAGGAAGGGRTTKLGLVNEAFQSNTVFSGLDDFTNTDDIKKYMPEAFETAFTGFSAIAPLVTFEAGGGASNVTAIRQIEVFYELVDYTNV